MKVKERVSGAKLRDFTYDRNSYALLDGSSDGRFEY
jgi:hypothetical protein